MQRNPFVLFTAKQLNELIRLFQERTRNNILITELYDLLKEALSSKRRGVPEDKRQKTRDR